MKIRLISATLQIAAFTQVCALVAHAQDDIVEIRGEVRREVDNQVLTGVTIQVTSDSSEIPFQLAPGSQNVTDVNGRFILRFQRVSSPIILDFNPPRGRRASFHDLLLLAGNDADIQNVIKVLPPDARLGIDKPASSDIADPELDRLEMEFQKKMRTDLGILQSYENFYYRSIATGNISEFDELALESINGWLSAFKDPYASYFDLMDGKGHLTKGSYTHQLILRVQERRTDLYEQYGVADEFECQVISHPSGACRYPAAPRVRRFSIRRRFR